MNKEKLLKSKSFCIMPWVHLATEPSGEAKICCLSNKRIKKDKESFNLGSDDVDAIFNSEQVRDNRKNMLNGVRIADCNHCWNEENNNGISQRVSFTEQWLNEHPEIIDAIEQAITNEYRVDYAPKYYDFRFGNLCNLKCRSCGSLNSTQINKEYTELKEQHPDTTFFSDSGDKYLHLNNWYKTDKFYQNVYSNIADIEKIYITGGEPTLIDENYQILSKIVEIGRAPKVSIMFNTNMTNLKDHYYELISNFKSVEMAISIEGFGKIQEYLRYPSKWTQIDKNIKKLSTMPNNVHIFAVPVVQAVNLEFITDFWKYIENINNEYNSYRIRMLPILLDSPQMSDFRYLPLDYKIQCLKKIEDYVKNSKWFKDDIHFIGRYNNIVSRCKEDNTDINQLKKLKHFTKILDKSRDQNLKEVNPKLYEILNNV